MPKIKHCFVCGDAYAAVWKQQKYCDLECRVVAVKKRKKDALKNRAL